MENILEFSAKSPVKRTSSKTISSVNPVP